MSVSLAGQSRVLSGVWWLAKGLQGRFSRIWDRLGISPTFLDPDKRAAASVLIAPTERPRGDSGAVVCNDRAPVRSPSRRVLLVEDAPFLRYAMARLLRLQGYEVREASDAQEALEQLEECRVDVVLTDMSLPDHTSQDLISRIRSNPRLASLAIVAITSEATPSADGLDAGVDSVVRKPVDLPDLFDRLRWVTRATA